MPALFSLAVASSTFNSSVSFKVLSRLVKSLAGLTGAVFGSAAATLVRAPVSLDFVSSTFPAARRDLAVPIVGRSLRVDYLDNFVAAGL